MFGLMKCSAWGRGVALATMLAALQIPVSMAFASSSNSAESRRFPVLVVSQESVTRPAKPSPAPAPAPATEPAEPRLAPPVPDAVEEPRLWLPGMEGGRVLVLPEAPLVSRLWWQSNPLEAVGASSGSYLGLGVADVTEQMAAKLNLQEVRGVVVTAVVEGSPAAKAGLRVKDVLISYNGNRLEGRQQLSRMVQETPAGRTVTVELTRDGKPESVKLTTAARRLNPEYTFSRIERPAAGRNLFVLPDLPKMLSIYRSPALGIESEALNAQLAEFFGVKEGVLVREVMADSPAAKAGLRAGDVIVSLGGETVSRPSEISSVLRDKAEASGSIATVVIRNQKKIVLQLTPSREWSEGRMIRGLAQDNTWSRK